MGLLALSACQEPKLVLPTPAQVRAQYDYEGTMKADLDGNVAEITVYQPVDQLRRGGTLWAEVGPYIFLFTTDTQKLFKDYSGLAAVRVITRLHGGEEIARAMLPRDTLTGLMWRRALNVAAHARLEGTKDPQRIADLIQWGEDHTDYRYNPHYIPNP